jgi:NADH-quinone oxidoreductase subunit A
MNNDVSTSMPISLVLYAAVVALVVGSMTVLSHFAGGRRKHRLTTPPYESGMTPSGSTHIQLSVSYYLMAMFFLIFDLEAAFIFAWAVSVKQAGWPAFVEMLVFIGLLMAGLLYLWHEGVLDWAAPPKPRSGQGLKQRLEE